MRKLCLLAALVLVALSPNGAEATADGTIYCTLDSGQHDSDPIRMTIIDYTSHDIYDVRHIMVRGHRTYSRRAQYRDFHVWESGDGWLLHWSGTMRSDPSRTAVGTITFRGKEGDPFYTELRYKNGRLVSSDTWICTFGD